MSVGQNLVGKVFHAGQYSTGDVGPPEMVNDLIHYYERDKAPGFPYAGDLKIESVTNNADGTTTIIGTVTSSQGPIQVGGKLIGNESDAIVIEGAFGNKRCDILLTNTFERQPGEGNRVDIASERDNNVYDPNAPCFTTGTLIRTARGDVAVENLEVGDLALTCSGPARPVRWIGSGATKGISADTAPVRIASGAFGAGLPARDLRLSPGHPVLVGADEDGAGGYLVPIMCLINGTTIERVPVDIVTYWHVELDQHDILLAEGLPAESYLDWGDRAFFTEGADHALANPDFVVPGLAGRCRPVALDGPIVEAERRRLDAVFAMSLAEVCAWPDHADDALFIDVTVGRTPNEFGRVWSRAGKAEAGLAG